MGNDFFDHEKPPTFSGKKLPSGIDWFDLETSHNKITNAVDFESEFPHSFDDPKDRVFPESIPAQLNIEMCRKYNKKPIGFGY